MSDHTARLTSVIQELAARFIQAEANTDPLITITSVHASEDSKHVSIFFTTIPENKQQDALIFLKRNAGEFRTYLKNKARLKAIPHIAFEVDYGERHRQHIDEVIRDIEDGKAD
jgi:ribosome-binding factor A